MVSAFDRALMNAAAELRASGFRRFAMEFGFFTLKQARACLFSGLFFLAVIAVPRAGLLGLPRYDVLLVLALLIQAWMVVAKLESRDELKAITLFHLIGLGLELFKTSSAVGSWAPLGSMPGAL